MATGASYSPCVKAPLIFCPAVGNGKAYSAEVLSWFVSVFPSPHLSLRGPRGGFRAVFLFETAPFVKSTVSPRPDLDCATRIRQLDKGDVALSLRLASSLLV